jgi:hypothetical protein
MQLGLERALDALESGANKALPRPPDRTGLVGLLTDELRRALKS